MRHPFSAIIAVSVAAIVSLTAIQLLAQTGGLLEGTAAFGDWHADRPGTRRLIKPQDLPAPDLAKSVRNVVRTVQRTDQKPIVPNGFEVNLFASGLSGPRIIRTAPNGDVFVAESEAGRIRVLRAGAAAAAQPSVFASGLTYPFGIAFYPPGPDPQWVYVGDTDAVLRFPYRNGDLSAARRRRDCRSAFAGRRPSHPRRRILAGWENDVRVGRLRLQRCRGHGKTDGGRAATLRLQSSAGRCLGPRSRPRRRSGIRSARERTSAF